MNNQPAVSGEGITFNPQQYVERSNIPDPGWSGYVQGQQSLAPSGTTFFNAQQSFERRNVSNPGWSGHMQGQQSFKSTGNMIFNAQQSVKIPNVANPGWSGNLQGQESLNPSGNMLFNTQKSFERSNISNPGWSGHLQGQQSLDPSGYMFFNPQQSFQRSNVANPGRSGHLQGPQALNPSGQQPRLGIAEQIYANQKVLDLTFMNLQCQKMQMQQQEQMKQQMKQQQMLQMQQNLPLSPPTKIENKLVMVGERLMQYMDSQRDRPQDNNIEFWKNFVAEFFGPCAKKKWCFSMYENKNHLTGVPPQKGHEWQCRLCYSQPGKGIEANVEILPRLFQIKYESGILEEFLHLKDPQEYQTPTGHIIIDYAKATQTSVFNQLRIVREGQLRVVFSPKLKICLLNFCARSHDEFISQTSLRPKVSQLKDAAQKYQAYAQDQNRSSDPELKNRCDGVVASVDQLEKSPEWISEYGYPKAYLRFLETAQTDDCMKDLIDFSIATEILHCDCLANFPKRARTMVELGQQSQQDQMQQQSAVQSSPSYSSQQSQTRRY